MVVDVKGILAGAKRAERSVPLCLRPDLVAQLQRLERELAEAERVDQITGSLGGGQSHDLAEQSTALRAQMTEHTIDVTLRALPRGEWTALLAAHPPREDNEADRALGLNAETFYDALVRRCVISPDFDTEDWARFEDVLSDGQWQALTNAAWRVNTSDGQSVPFSQRASQILASSAIE